MNNTTILEFNPTEVGLIKNEIENEVFYDMFDKDNNLVGWITYHDWAKPPLWYAYKLLHYENDGTPRGSLIYRGMIPDNDFAKKLFNNIFIR